MSGRRLRVAVLGAARSGRSRLVAELAAASPALLPFEVDQGQISASTALGVDLILLTGLDLPANNLPATEQTRQDSALRQALQALGLSWHVVYGQGQARTRNALQAVAEVAPWAWEMPLDDAEAGRWQRLQAHCEKCGDASCEHRLFTGRLLP